MFNLLILPAQHFTRMSRPVVWMLMLVLVIESLVPLGFMPTSVKQGSWIAICPAQQSALNQLVQHSHMHHAMHNGTHNDSQSEKSKISAKTYCDWGSQIQSIMLPVALLLIAFVIFPSNNHFHHRLQVYKRNLVTTGNRDPPTISSCNLIRIT